MHHWRNYWIYSGSIYRLPAYVLFSIAKQQNWIYAFHPMILSFMSICWHIPWIQKQVSIGQYLVG